MGNHVKKPMNYRMSEEHRSKIANSQILNCLIEHVEGRRPMSPTQVTAGVALLRKVLPDIAVMQVTSEDPAQRLEFVWASRVVQQPAEPVADDAPMITYSVQ